MKILLVRTGGLGDCILTLPVAVCLRQINPRAELYVLGNATMLSVARLSGVFDGMYNFENQGFSPLFSDNESSQFLKDFFSSFDEVYFFTACDREQIERAVMRAGARKCCIRNPNQPAGWHRHITEHLLGIVDNERKKRIPGYYPLPVLLENPCTVRKGLAIHPGSGGLNKIWPIDRFIAAAAAQGDETTFILGPAEVERGFENMIPVRFRVVRPESPEDLCHVLSHAALYLGNDSGASHCAALCGTRSVVLFGPTDPVVWKPLGDTVMVIESDGGTMEGIETDTVQRALEAAAQL
jgi:ADP-heptose:LPS heptosyltransferase